MHLQHVGEVGVSFYIDFQKARGRATARRRQLLVAAEKEGDAEALKKLALEECLQRRLIASEDGLEDLDWPEAERVLMEGRPEGTVDTLYFNQGRWGWLGLHVVRSSEGVSVVARRFRELVAGETTEAVVTLEDGAGPDGVREGHQVRLGGGHLTPVRLAQLCHRPSVLSASDELVEAERQEPRDANVDGLDEPAFSLCGVGPIFGGTESVCARRRLAGPASAADEQDPQQGFRVRV